MQASSAVKERPILFSVPMVQALLAGRKTQTRRLMKSQPYTLRSEGFGYATKAGGFVSLQSEHCFAECPYGKPGDRLWVRETFGVDCMFGKYSKACISNHHEHCVAYRASITEGVALESWSGHWRPSIHMPHWASRLTLEITDVRVQRLQDISEKDAKAEGAFFTNYGRNCFHGQGVTDVGGCSAPDSTHPQRDGWSMTPTTNHGECLGSAKMAFANFWCKLAGDPIHNIGPAWDANPWIWAVSFKVLDALHGQREVSE